MTKRSPSMGRTGKAARGGPDHVSPDRNAIPHRPTNGQGVNASLHPLGSSRITESGQYPNIVKNPTSIKNPTPSGEDGHAQGAALSFSSSLGFKQIGAQGHVHIPTEPASMRKRILSPGQEGAKRRRLQEMDTIVQAGASSAGEGTRQLELREWGPPGAAAACWPAPAPQQQQKMRKPQRRVTGNPKAAEKPKVTENPKVAEKHKVTGNPKVTEKLKAAENLKAKKAAVIKSTADHKLPGPSNGTAMKDLLRRLDVTKKIEIIRDENVAWNNEHPNQPRPQSLRGSYIKEEFLIFTENSVICELCIKEMNPMEMDAHIRLGSHRGRVECMKKERDWLENYFSNEAIVID